MINFVWFFIGCVLWTLTEYLLHRFIGHEWILKKKVLTRGLDHFRSEHAKHHFKRNYYGPTNEKIKAAFVIGPLLFGLASIGLPLISAGAFAIGFLVMYSFYEWFHRQLHISPPKGRLGRVLQKHHYFHHFEDENMNHGVTSRFWDVIFGTYVPVTKVEVNKNFSMSWLYQNQEAGIVKDCYANEYISKDKTRHT